MKLSYFSYIGYGFALATIYGIYKLGLSDYRVQGVFILAVCFLLRDPIYEMKQRRMNKN